MATQYHLVPPEPQGMLTRPRLWSGFGTTGEPTLVWGHRGAGKTTAAVDWIRNGPDAEDNGVAVWFDAGSRAWERGRFWRQVVQLLDDTHHGARKRDPIPAGADTTGFAPHIRRVLAAMGRPVVLVIDGVRRLQADLFRDILDLSATTDSLRVAVILAGPTQPDSRRVLRSRHVAALGPVELAFTPRETEELLGRGRTAPLRGYASALHRLVAGDPLATAALIRELDRMDAPVDPAKLDISAVRDVIRFDALESVPGAVPILRRLVLAHQPILPLVREIAADGAAAEILGEVEAIGLGTWSPIDAEPRFHLSPPVGRLLRTEYPLARDEEGEVLRTVGRWADEHGDLVNVLGSALDLDDTRTFEELVRNELGRLTVLSQPSLAYLLRRGTAGAGEAGPWKSLLPAIAYAHYEGLRTTAKQSLGPPREAGDGDRVAQIVSSYVTMVAHRATGDVAAALDAGSTVFPDSPNPPAGEPDDAENAAIAVTGVEWALHLAAAGDQWRAKSVLDRILETDHPSEPPPLRFRAQVLRGVLDARDGDLRMGTALVRGAGTPDRPRTRRADAAETPLDVLEAWLALEELDIDGALDRLQRAEALTDTVEFWTLVAEPLSQAAYLYRGAENPWTWLSRRVLPPNASQQWRFHHARARALFDLAQGDHEGAISWFGDLEQRPEVAVERARAHLHAEQLAPTRHFLDIAEAGGLTTPRLRADHAGLNAVVELRTREHLGGVRGVLDTIAILSRRDLPLAPLAMLPARERDILLALRQADTGPVMPGGEGESVERVRVAAGLTAVDLELLRLLSQGRKLAQIATIRFVSINTIKSQLRNLYRKLGVSTRNGAVEIARRLGLVERTEPAEAAEAERRARDAGTG